MPRVLPPKPPPTTAERIEILSKLRRHNVRDSRQVCLHGEAILEANGTNLLKDDVYAFLDQLAVAALDSGKLDLARVCIDRLAKRFPDSPRVKPLQGMGLEAEGHFDAARLFYEKELLDDENNMGIRKRLISLHLHHSGATSSTTAQPSTSKALASKSTAKLSQQRGIEMLVAHLDTVYTDAEAWQELADVYSSLGLYQQALSALGDLILLQPQNPHFVLHYAETAYTVGDLELAYRMFLRVIELSGKNGIIKGGIARRAALGVKLCIPKLQGTGFPGSKAPSPNSATGTPSPQKLDDVDLIITEALFDAYSTEWAKEGDRAAGHKETKAVKSWLAGVSSSGTEIKR